MSGTCQLLQAINILGEVFRKFLFILEDLQEVVSGVRQVILAREELFSPRIKRSWILSKVVEFEDGLRVWQIIFL